MISLNKIKMQELLEFAGTLNMSEGNYLKVANALRDVFPKLNEEERTLQWEHSIPTGEFRIIMQDFIYNTGIVRSVFDFTKSRFIRVKRNGNTTTYIHAYSCDVVHEYADKKIEKKMTMWSHNDNYVHVAKPKTIQLIMEGVEYTYTIQQYGKDEIEFKHQGHLLMNGDDDSEWDEQAVITETFAHYEEETWVFYNNTMQRFLDEMRSYCNQIRDTKEFPV
jgi:hypothetical protein